MPYGEVITKAFGTDFTLTPSNYETNEYVQQAIGVQVQLKATDE